MGIMLILGVASFFGNWLLVPLFSKIRTHRDGFFVGLIAFVLFLIVGGIMELFAFG